MTSGASTTAGGGSGRGSRSGSRGAPGAEHLFEPRRVPEAQRNVGPFRLLHELGSGGMASLYLATDDGGRLVAVKQLHEHLANERSFVEMFEDEARIARRIAHPNVCDVMRIEEHDGRKLIVMEYVHGESLGALCQACQRTGAGLPLAAALHLVGQACLGLDAAHQLTDDDGKALHVVHRDVSPANLLVGYDGTLKVVDFGIAAAAEKLHRTATGAIKGRFSYMSPEQTRSAQLDRRSDVFALGAVFYEVVCGQPAFPMTNMADTIRRVETCDYRPPSDVRADLPGDVEAIIARALSRDAARRYPSCALMYEDIYRALSATGGSTTERIGELMRRVFAQRFAVREELRALAFSAPDVLEEEELSLVTDTPVASGPRCEYCGEAQHSAAALDGHYDVCGQKRWWVHNFGGDRAVDASGDAAMLRARAQAHTRAPEKKSLWQRVKDRFKGRDKRDPLVIRLETINARIDRVREPRAAGRARQGMSALWGIVAEVDAKSPTAARLLARLKPGLLRCANALLTLVLEIDANESYLVGLAAHEIEAQIELLRRRHGATAEPTLRATLERNIARKEQLVAEHRRLAKLGELLMLRLDSMCDAMELCYGKVLQMAASPVFVEEPATTQVTVFVDALLLDIEHLGASVRELEDTLQA